MSSLKSNEKFTYNEDTKKYVFHTKEKFGKNYVFGQDKVNTIIKLYSNFDKNALKMGDIALKLGIPKEVIKFVINTLKITHDSLPFTKETVDEMDADELVDEMIVNKDFAVAQKFEKADWKKTQTDAEKWRQYKLGKVAPLSDFLNTWKPPALPPLKTLTNSLHDAKSDKTCVVVLSDLHYGSYANASYMFNRPTWTTKDTVAAVDKFAKEIAKEVSDRKYKYNKCVIMSLGDLIHSLNGKTGRGTELIYDCVKEEQFDYALESLMSFMTRMIEIFGKCEVHSVYGNHNYETEMALFRALDMFFKKDNRIEFKNHSSRPAAFKTGNTLIMMDHGADSKERAYVPLAGPKLEKHVQSIMVNNPDLLQGVKTKLFCQGDKHHFQHLEYSSFEFLMFGTTLVGDEHANVNNLYSRARQSMLVLDNSGLRETIHVYFD
jgi:hypothetical protein